MRNISIFGVILSSLYLIFCTYLILSQGLFGESFIAIWLGMPWSLILAYFNDLLSANFTLGIYAFVLLPIILNVIILYFIGKTFEDIQKRVW